MHERLVLSLVLDAHSPFINHPEDPHSVAEHRFFELITDTYIPLLMALERLENDHIPYRLAFSISPTLCHMLRDERLIARYMAYVDARAEFGYRELERTSGRGELHELALYYHKKTLEEREFFTEKCGRNLVRVFAAYQRKGKIELLATAATHAFLPFYAEIPEAVQAQVEIAQLSYRSCFEKNPQGFWLPELGWSPELDSYIRAYNFGYTIVNPHALIIAGPPAPYGNFCPVKTPLGTLVLGRDYNVHRDFWNEETGFIQNPVYRDSRRDLGYELSPEELAPCLSSEGGRTATGYKYWANGSGGRKKPVYNPALARQKSGEHARRFLDARIAQLSAARELAGSPVVSVAACDAGDFGHIWYEGIDFLEALFREGAGRREIQFMTPAEYLYKQDTAGCGTVTPEFSSWGVNGYAEAWLDASNDWIYRHIFFALARMTELAERFPDDTGLKERALNQAAREILLVQESVWARMMSSGEEGQYARSQVENSLKNFTMIYESLGSNYISTEWLTGLERRNNVFDQINYRVFRRKK